MEQDKVKNKEQNKGRPSKYNPAYHDSKAYEYFSCGYTNVMVAKKFEINPRTLDLWINTHDSLREKVQDGRQHMEGKIENNLFKLAFGYFQEITEPKIAGGEIVMVTYRKYFPKSFSANRFLSTNLMPHKYRDRVEYSETDEVTKPLAINIKVVKNDD